MGNLEKIITSGAPQSVSMEPVSDEVAQAVRVRARLVDALSKEANTPLLAPMLKRLQQGSGLSPAQMASRLGTTLSGLDRLALCRIPRDDRFFLEAEIIARYCDCDLTALVSLLRSVQVLATFAQPVTSSATSPSAARHERFGWQASGALVAARDADEITERGVEEAGGNTECDHSDE